MAHDKNPIERRLDQLREQWSDFVEDPDARLLRWLLADDEVRMLETFLTLEGDDQGGVFPDLFLRLATPFADPDTYTAELRSALLDQYEQARPDLIAESVPADWRCPPSTDPSPDSIASISHSLQRHYQDLIQHLALVLLPEQIKDPITWQSWIAQLTQAATSESVRIVILDHVRTPRFAALMALPQARSVAAALDMPGALLEISQAAGRLDRPEGQFRHLNLQMMNALSQGDLDDAAALGQRALSVADAQPWPHLVVSVHFALGAGFLSASRFADAIERFQAAALHAGQAAQAGDPSGPALLARSLLSLGAAFLGSGDYFAAAHAYQQAGTAAEQMGDRLLQLEGFRMAAHCREARRELDGAWACALRGLDAAEAMDPAARARSTLPFLGRELLALMKHAGPVDRKDAADRRMRTLLGSGWQQAVRS